MPSLLTLVMWIWFYHHPLLIWATGFPKASRFEALRQNPWPSALGSDSAEWDKYNTLNWDGQRLFVDGGGIWEGDAWAPPGTFILAALPHGIGIAWHRGGANPYEAMEGPHIVPYVLIALAGLLLPFGQPILRAVVARHRRQRGLCPACGYDLTGNTSGVCPECGRKALAMRGLREGHRLGEDVRGLIDEGRR